MNSVRNYFSPTKLEPSSLNPSPSTSSRNELISTPSTSELEKSTDTAKSAKTDSRKIISNMESVIKSVKKRRHRKKKVNGELNRSEPEILDISNILSNSLKFISPNASMENAQVAKENIDHSNGNSSSDRKGEKCEGQEHSIRVKSGESEKLQLSTPSDASNVKSPKNESLSRSKSIANKKKGDQLETPCVDMVEMVLPEKTEVDSDSNNPEEKSTPKMNAFTLMMNARNRVIGSNQNGLDLSSAANASTSPANPEKFKRKLMLQDWANKKGGTKRKLAEVEREEYIEHQMEKRTKRLKKMLVGEKQTPKSTKKSKNIVNTPNCSQDLNEAFIASSDESKMDDTTKKRGIKYRGKVKDAISTPSTSNQSKDATPSSTKTNSTRKKRTRRIISTESAETTSNESKDTEFLQKLASPIKKRDSLLGYFPKIVSPDESEKKTLEVSSVEDITPIIQNVPKKRGRKPKSAIQPDKPVLIETETSVVVDAITTRPRRSCAGRIRYNDLLSISPEKTGDARNKRTKSSPINVTAKESTKQDRNVSDDIICLDESDTPKNATKLAPVFMKNVPKPAIDPAILQAKKDFLMSGIPEKMKLEIAKQKQFEDNLELSLESMFPKISHVGCESNQEVVDATRNTDLSKCGILWREMTNSPDKPCKVETACDLTPFTPLKKPLTLLEELTDVENKVDIVKSWKVAYKKFPTYRCYKQLRAKYKQTKNMAVQQVSDSFVILDMNSKTKEDIGSATKNGELMFTEKYKPICSEQVLVNFHPVNKLKDFLSNWQSGKFSKLNESFEDFDARSNSNCCGTSNTVVLYGPSSSGKTNAVFALANEMNFNVLEINAGMKRNGKKMLQELQEATQSHLVNNDKSNLPKRISNGLKTKNVEVYDNSSTSELSGSTKLSLILVEDADIVLEQDSGFIDAINQLVATSKRPVIIISNSAECPHLVRIQKQSSIEFPVPNVLNISKFLSVMSLVENCPIELDDIIRLYLYNKQNLRKTLLELQFFIQSGGDRERKSKVVNCLPSPQKFLTAASSSDTENVVDDKESTYKPTTTDVYTHQTLFDFFTKNQNSNFMISFPVDFDCLHYNLGDIVACIGNEPEKIAKNDRKVKKLTGPAKKQTDSSLEDIVNFYDDISVASYLTSDEISDGLIENLQETISHTIVEKAIRFKTKSNIQLDSAPRDKPQRQMLATMLPQHLLRTNRSIDLDFEPALRTICRSEKARSMVERRGSRFYHYLRNICMNTNNFSVENFDRACSIFASETTENDGHI